MKRATDIDISKIDTQSIEFQNALQLISYTSQSLFLTGKAGTGKSTFLKYLTATTKKKYVVLAPTGIAAVNAGGQTLHSFFKLPFKPMMPDDPDVASISRLKARMRYSAHFIKLLKELDLIIIDEVSMVRADTIDLIDRLLRVYCGNFRQPFGGKQMLLVGDVFQLEPVITGEIRDILNYYYKNGTYFFNANVFSEVALIPIELRKVYRQKDADFIALLDRVRLGSPSQQDISQLNARLLPPGAPQTAQQDYTMTIATRRDIVDYINDTHLKALKPVPRKFVGIINGDFPEASLPTDKELVLKIGAQVVFVKNDPERRWVNGSIGVITEFGDDTITVQMEDGEKHAVTMEVWQNMRYEYDEAEKKVNEIELGSFAQFPLKLAWALTIHKSQGLTFDKVIVDMGPGAFSGGQAYVALSRSRSLQGISMRSTINQRDIFVNRRVVDFSHTFNDNRLISNALELSRADNLYHQSAQAFDAGNLSLAVDLFFEAFASKPIADNPAAMRLVKRKLAGLAAYKHENERLMHMLEQDSSKFEKLASEYVELAETCRQEAGDAEAAIKNYEKAIAIAPEYQLAWLGKGLAMAQMSEFDSAISCLDTATNLDKKDWRAPYEAGCLMVESGDLAQGMDYLLRAEERNKKSSKICFALAAGYEKAGDERRADAYRKKAERLRKKNK